MNRIEKAKQMEKAHFPKVSFLQEDPEMQQIMKLHLFADVYGHGTLDFTMREYITLAVMAANNAEELITDHVKAYPTTAHPGSNLSDYSLCRAAEGTSGIELCSSGFEGADES